MYTNDFYNAVEKEGINTEYLREKGIIADGNIKRFKTKGNSFKESGWYFLHLLDGKVQGTFGDHRIMDEKGINFEWYSEDFKKLNDKEKAKKIIEMEKQEKEKKEKYKKEKEKSFKEVEERLDKEYYTYSLEINHKYFEEKKMELSNNVLQKDNLLKILLFKVDEDNPSKKILCNVQSIDEEGNKRFEKGGQVKEAFSWYGQLKRNLDKICIVEGIADASTVYNETNIVTVCAFSRNEIYSTINIMNKYYNPKEIIIIADNDKDKKAELQASYISSKESNVSYIIVPEGEKSGYDINDYYIAGNDVRFLITGEKKQSNELFKIFDKRKKEKDLIKGVLPAVGCSMIYGQSQAGKTFITMDMAGKISLGLNWNERETLKTQVFLFAGEGKRGMTSRVLGFCEKNKIEVEEFEKNFKIYFVNYYLDREEGLKFFLKDFKFLEKSEERKLFIFDTYSKFKDGEENSSSDVNRFINSLNIINEKMNASSIFLHHVGKTNLEGGNKTPRGSAAFIDGVEAAYRIEKMNNNESKIISEKNRDGKLLNDIYVNFSDNNLKFEDEFYEVRFVDSFINGKEKYNEKVKEYKEEGKKEEIYKQYNEAWNISKLRNERNNKIISRKDLFEYLKETFTNLSERTINNRLSQSNKTYIFKNVDNIKREEEIKNEIFFELIENESQIEKDISEDKKAFEEEQRRKKAFLNNPQSIKNI